MFSHRYRNPTNRYLSAGPILPTAGPDLHRFYPHSVPKSSPEARQRLASRLGLRVVPSGGQKRRSGERRIGLANWRQSPYHQQAWTAGRRNSKPSADATGAENAPRLGAAEPTHGEQGLGALASLENPELVTFKSLLLTNIVVNPVGRTAKPTSMEPSNRPSHGLPVEEWPVAAAFPEVGKDDQTCDRRVRTPHRREGVPLDLHYNQENCQVRPAEDYHCPDPREK